MAENLSTSIFLKSEQKKTLDKDKLPKRVNLIITETGVFVETIRI